jgi:predicted nucleic acid-binding protein
VALVVDANVVVAACLASDDALRDLGPEELIAPDLMWWEAASTLHEYQWRIEAGHETVSIPGLTREDVGAAVACLRRAPVRSLPTTAALLDEAWWVADRCGLARLYDAAYVALARLEGARLVTLDAPLRRGPAARLATIVGPDELGGAAGTAS